MKRRDLERHLRDHGCQFAGEGARHAKWHGPEGKASTSHDTVRSNRERPGRSAASSVCQFLPQLPESFVKSM